MEEIFSLPPIEDFFNNDYSLVLEFMDTLGNPKFKIAGNVNLYNRKDIESIGNLVEVEGNLNLEGTNITSLPNNLKVGGYLELTSTKITSLPDNLYVGSSLYLYGTNITSLPNNLHVGRDLSLGNTKLTSLPDNLHVGGSLSLYNTPISKTYTEEEIRKMIEDKGGFVKGKIKI